MPSTYILGFTLMAVLSAGAIAQDITVTAPRHRERSSTTGAPIETVSTSRVVNAADLDLNSPAGMSELKRRVESAATTACQWLDQLYPDTSDDSCVKSAANRAMDDVRTRVASAPQ